MGAPHVAAIADFEGFKPVSYQSTINTWPRLGTNCPKLGTGITTAKLAPFCPQFTQSTDVNCSYLHNPTVFYSTFLGPLPVGGGTQSQWHKGRPNTSANTSTPAGPWIPWSDNAKTEGSIPPTLYYSEIYLSYPNRLVHYYRNHGWFSHVFLIGFFSCEFSPLEPIQWSYYSSYGQPMEKALDTYPVRCASKVVKRKIRSKKEVLMGTLFKFQLPCLSTSLNTTSDLVLGYIEIYC